MPFKWIVGINRYAYAQLALNQYRLWWNKAKRERGRRGCFQSWGSGGIYGGDDNWITSSKMGKTLSICEDH